MRALNRAIHGPPRVAARESSMRQVVIENPVFNSPFDEPTRHFRFADDGITDEVIQGRRTRLILRAHRSARRGPATRLTPNGLRIALRRESPSSTISAGVSPCGVREAISASHPPPLGCLPTGQTPTGRKSSFFARSRPWRPPSTSPRSHKDSAMPGSRMLCARPTTVQSRPAPHH